MLEGVPLSGSCKRALRPRGLSVRFPEWGPTSSDTLLRLELLIGDGLRIECKGGGSLRVS